MEMIKFKNKFHLSPEQSLFLGKKKWDENVYCGMKMENRKVTFPQVQTVLNGINVPNVQLEDIQAILNMRDAWILNDTNTSATDKALKIFIWGTRGQFFWDGNKRTSLLLSNKILLSAGAGIMTITDKYMEQFNFLLLNYYNTGAAEKLKQFLYENAIQGMKI